MKKTHIVATTAILALGTLGAFGAESPARATQPIVKKETVYAILSPAGEVKNVIVSDWLHSPVAGATLRDKSALTDIVNVQSDDKPSIAGTAVVWAPKGQDVYYQGKTQAKPPLDVKVSYFLDGKPMTAAAIAGKAGRVRIEIRARNTDTRRVKFNGVERDAQTPFVAAVMLNLPAATFTDVEVSANGRAIGDGQSDLVLGVLLPGLAKTLSANPEIADAAREVGISAETLPETLTVSATTKSFSLGSIFITASSDISALLPAQKADGSKGKSGGSLDVAALGETLRVFAENGNRLEQGVGKLADGSDKLRDGINTLYGAAGPLLGTQASVTLTASAASTATDSVLTAACALIQDDARVAAARRLMADAKYLNSRDLSAIKLLPGFLDAKNSAVLKKTMEDAKGLDLSGILNLPFANFIVSDENVKNLAEALTASDAFYAGVSEKKLATALALGDDAQAIAADQALLATVAGLKAAETRAALLDRIAASNLSREDQAALGSLVNSVPEIAAAQAYLAPDNAVFVDGVLVGVGAQKTIHDKNRANYGMAESILKLASKNGGFRKTIKKLDTVQRDLAELAPLVADLQNTLDSGALAALGDPAELATKLVAMSDDLAANRELLAMAEGLLSEESVTKERELAGRLPELTEGVIALHDGANQLADGMAALSDKTATFNQKGIQVLAAKLGAFADLAGNAKAVSNELLGLSKDYDNFAGIGAGMEGHVKFIMRTEAITAK